MLPALIEYLLAQRREGGMAPVCFPLRWQFVLDPIPPNTRVTFNVAPPIGIYAAIKYAATYPDDMVPGAVYAELTHFGHSIVIGDFEADWTRTFLPYFCLFTHADPLYAEIANNTNLNQRLIITQYSVAIPSEEDLAFVYKHIDEYSCVVSNNLLRQIVAVSGGAKGWVSPLYKPKV